jgi:hypothetical protein
MERGREYLASVRGLTYTGAVVWCGRRELNPHGVYPPPAPKAGAAAKFRHYRTNREQPVFIPS